MAAVQGNVVDLSWINPEPASGNSMVRLVRRLNGAPTDAFDPAAVLVFSGSATSAIDQVRNLLPDTATQARDYTYAVYGCSSASQCDPTASVAMIKIELTVALRAGGYVLHWRHASADVCQDNLALGTAANTSTPNWWKSCEANCAMATARQLNTKGLSEATTIGDELRARAIPFGRVVSSEYCRNFTTAERMNLGPTIELSPTISYFVYDEANRCNNVQALLREVPVEGKNTALIGHAGFSGSCAGVGDLAWSEAAIFKPDGIGGSAFIARITATQWASFPNPAIFTPTPTAIPTASPSPTATPRTAPSELVSQFDANAHGVLLNWLNPDPASGSTSVRVVRRLNSDPQGPFDADADVVFTGAATSVLDPVAGLLPDTIMDARQYHYAVYGCRTASDCESQGSMASIRVTVAQALRGGGYVIHWRHAMANVCTDKFDLGPAATTSSPGWWKSCDANCATATARQLNDTGVQQATTIGNAIRAQGIPIGRMLSSEFCRAVSSAELMNFGPPIEQRSDLTFMVYDDSQRCANSYALLSTAPAAGSNVGIVAHGYTDGCAVLENLFMGHAAIFKPLPAGGTQFILRVLDTEWAGL